MTLVACAPEPVRVTSITLNTKAITLEVGASEKLSATVSPNNADNPAVIWTSDDASIAKVLLERRRLLLKQMMVVYPIFAW